jgi:hypothetical protein
MKRHGCIDCKLMEPVAGQWIGGLCPACTKMRAERKARQAEPAEPKPPKQDATAARLQGCLRAIAQQYPDLWKHVDRLRAERGRTIPKWPSWCFMPFAGAYAIASGGQDDAPPERLGAIAALATLAAWRPTQGIYRFDATVAAAVQDTPISGDIPTEILHHIPEWCVYIDTPGSDYLGAPSAGFFALLECDANDGREELRIVADMGDGQLSAALPVWLNRGGLVAGIEAATEEAARQAAIYRPKGIGPTAQAILACPPSMLADALTPRINLLLYLCSTNAEMRQRDTGRLRPSKPTLTKTKDGMRMFPAEKPAAWDVGFRLGAAIRHAREQEQRKPGDGTHASPRAHIRRAHWHSFWTGPKAKVGMLAPDRKLVLKWLPPMAVNVEDELETVPTIHPVQ